jgi:hypothetical protein
VTPILQYSFNWKTLSAMAGITFYNFYFRLYPGTVKSAQVVDFLEALLRQLSGPLLIVWDRLAAYRSGLVATLLPNRASGYGWNTFPPMLPS